MAAILAQMQRDRVGAGRLGHQRGLHRARIARAARLAQRGDVVDVDTELNESIVRVTAAASRAAAAGVCSACPPR